MPEYFTIKVSGKQLEPKVFIDVVELAVDTSVFLPAMLSLTLNDNVDKQRGSFNYADTKIFPLGGEITVDVKTDELEYSTGNISGKLFSGVIAAVEPQFLDEGRALLRIRAYDHSFKLTRGKKTRVFGDGNPNGAGISEADILKKVIQGTTRTDPSSRNGKSRTDTLGSGAGNREHPNQRQVCRLPDSHRVGHACGGNGREPGTR